MSTQKPGTLPLIESHGVWMKIRLLPLEHAHALTDRGENYRRYAHVTGLVPAMSLEVRAAECA